MANKIRERTPPFAVGAVFGQLTIESYIGRSPRSIKVYKALCSCGAPVIVLHSDLNRGDTKSCGCLKRGILSERNRAATNPNKQTGSPEYESWAAARYRCLSPSSKDYPKYGGAGVTFCLAWADSFPSFFDHIGPRPKGTSLDRIDNELGYEPGNVRWATPSEQCANRSTTRWVEVDGKRLPAATAALLLGITPASAYKRLQTKGTIYGDPRSNRKGPNSKVAES